MKHIIIMLLFVFFPLFILADEFDDAPKTGNPQWYYFDYTVKYKEGGTISGKMKVCASNVGVAIGTARNLLNEKYGKHSMQLRKRGKGGSCEEDGTGVLFE